MMLDPISWEFAWPYYLAAFALAYLLGSIPFGLVLTRLAGYGDIRQIGSGNIGATNVLRTGNKPLALAVLILDSGKGALAVAIASINFGTEPEYFAALGAFLGHLFPIWLKFQGGKGVATTLGILLMLHFPTGLWIGGAACLTWLIVAVVARYSSLSALIAIAHAPLHAMLWDLPYALVEVTVIIAVVVWIKHAGNIKRLMAGTEPRIGEKQTAEAGDGDRGSAPGAEPS